MLLTLAEMRVRLLRRVPGSTPQGLDDAINDAYSSLTRVHPWTNLETEFKLQTVAAVQTGGAKFTNGSNSITAATTVSASWSTDFTGYFIKKYDDAAYYTITSSTSIAITLSENYGGSTTTAAASSGDSYSIFKHVYVVDSSVETVERLVYNDSYLRELDAEQFERLDSDLNESGEISRWRNAGINSAGQCLVQLFPPIQDAIYDLRGRGRKRVETLTNSTKPLLDSLMIISFAEVDLLRRKKIHSPSSVPEGSLEGAMSIANDLLEVAMKSDSRRRTSSPYVKDRFLSPYRGHKWYTEHDPWDA